MTVGRNELVRRASEVAGMPETDVREAVSAFLDEMLSSLAAGETVALRRFGKFQPRTRPASVRPNPRTGDPMRIPRRKTVTFLPSATMREELNR